MPAQTFDGDLAANQLAVRLGLARWQLRLGREHGLLPEPDLDGERWSAGLVEECAQRRAQVVARFGGEPPIGAVRAAARLAGRTGLDVERRDIEVLVARGHLEVIGGFRGHPLYLLRDIDALDPEEVREVVAARKGPLFDTVEASGAVTILGWPRKTFDRIAGERALPTDRFGRYALADIRALAADEGLAQEVREEKRRRALAKARRAETDMEDVVRGWLLRCTAYVDRAADEPPDPAVLARAIRGLAGTRAETAKHEQEPG
ncbi:hypothetical protein [Actinomadura opuntiae]|uniref:hypothetical protein n=1 Tax=Actinomadura sp. OS1-43 TaxID=604315 RepID=UPI00255AC339|nr:hypothetical protein [Actinomadura sp. OS1-43]MDL4813929.1 hypothetical protein [Actinomadura sp. OS1-43]